jgi:hypothetical protein
MRRSNEQDLTVAAGHGRDRRPQPVHRLSTDRSTAGPCRTQAGTGAGSGSCINW